MALLLLKRYWPHLLFLVLVLTLGYRVYDTGFQRGAESVQIQWDKERAEYQGKIAKLEDDIEQQEASHRQGTSRITHELSEARRLHEVELARSDAVYQRRLQHSEERAEIYRRQAEGGSAERGDLAEHTARLDRSLEEGRSLVRELRETLGLRERELRAVGQQLLNDRKLFETPADE